MSNKMALDALTAAVQLCEWIAETPHQRVFGGQVAANARQPAVTAPPTKELDVVDGQVVEDGDSN